MALIGLIGRLLTATAKMPISNKMKLVDNIFFQLLFMVTEFGDRLLEKRTKTIIIFCQNYFVFCFVPLFRCESFLIDLPIKKNREVTTSKVLPLVVTC